MIESSPVEEKVFLIPNGIPFLYFEITFSE